MGEQTGSRVLQRTWWHVLFPLPVPPHLPNIHPTSSSPYTPPSPSHNPRSTTANASSASLTTSLFSHSKFKYGLLICNPPLPPTPALPTVHNPAANLTPATPPALTTSSASAAFTCSAIASSLLPAVHSL